MPFDGSGNFSRLYSWQSDRDNGIRILASKMDGEFDNFAAGMNVVFFRNGLVPMSGTLNMGQNSIAGLAAGSVGALSLRFADDPNSGLYLNGYNKPALVSNGVNRLEANTAGVAVTGTLNSTGNLSENGSRVWTAATFAPGNYALLTGAQFSGNVIAPQMYARNGTNGEARMVAGGSNNTGFIEFWRPGGAVREGYIGNALSGGAIEYNGNSHSFIGTVSTSGALNASGAITQSGNQVWHAGNLTPTDYMPKVGANLGSGNFELTTTGQHLRMLNGAELGVVSLNSTGGVDIWSHGDNATDIIRLITGSGVGTERARVTSSGLGVTGSVSASIGMTIGGQAVWHAGNLTPGNYAALAGATFTGAVGVQIAPGSYALNVLNSAQTIANFQSSNVSGGYVVFTAPGSVTSGFMGADTAVSGTNSTADFAIRSGGMIILRAGGAGEVARFTSGGLNVTGAMQNGGNQVWHAGNLTPGNYLTTANAATTYAALAGATFTGAINRDANFGLNIVSSNPRITLDSTDYFEFNRSTNKLTYYVGGTGVMSIDAAGNMKVLGTVTASAGTV